MADGRSTIENQPHNIVGSPLIADKNVSDRIARGSTFRGSSRVSVKITPENPSD
jgi:hypothetical protein